MQGEQGYPAFNPRHRSPKNQSREQEQGTREVFLVELLSQVEVHRANIPSQYIHSTRGG